MTDTQEHDTGLLTFDPTKGPKSWMVRRDDTGEIIGSIEWHGELGAYGFAAAPGRPLIMAHLEALDEIGRFVDRENDDVVNREKADTEA